MSQEASQSSTGAKSAPSYWGALQRCFEEPCPAFFVTGLLLVLVVGAYLLVHAFRTPPENPWKGAVAVSPDATFELIFIEEKLTKFFTAEDIVAFKEVVLKKREEYRQGALSARLRVFTGLYQDVLDPAFGSANPLARIMSPAAARAKDASLWNVIASVNLAELRDWLQKHADLISPEAVAIDQGGAGKRPNKRDLAAAYVAELDSLIAGEGRYRQDLEAQIAALEPPLSFTWLWHAGAGWVFEVSVWTLLGLLANTMIALIVAVRQGDYDSCTFLLLFPKMLIAPILSLVVIAVWQSGSSDVDIIMNLPFFLVVSFVLGFGTERIYASLRSLVTALIPRLQYAPEKRTSMAEKLRSISTIARTHLDMPPETLAPAQTLAELEENLKRDCNSIVEKTLTEWFSERNARLFSSAEE